MMLETVVVYHIPIRDKNTGEVKLWRLKEGSVVLEQLIKAGAVERTADLKTLKVNSPLFLE